MDQILITLTFLLVLFLLLKVITLETRLKGMKYTLEKLAEHSNVEDPINNYLRDLIKEGNDVLAVKRARDHLGLSLIEAKNYIENLKEQV